MKMINRNVCLAWLFAFFCCGGMSQMVTCVQGQEQLGEPIKNAVALLISEPRVATRDPGIISEIMVKPGQQVVKGQVLVKLNSDGYEIELRAAVKEHEIALKESENIVDMLYADESIKLNTKILQRAEDAVLAYSKSLSATQVDEARLEKKRSVLSKKQAEHQYKINQLTEEWKYEQVEAAQLRLNYREIISPIDGIVVSVDRQVGEAVSAYDFVGRVVNMDRLRVKVAVDLESISHIRVGDTCDFVVLRDEIPFTVQAEITFISPEISAGNDVDIHAEFDNTTANIKSGMGGRVQLYKHRPGQ